MIRNESNLPELHIGDKDFSTRVVRLVEDSGSTAMNDMSESKRADDEIAGYRVQLTQHAAQVEAVRESERVRIARDIHDDLGGNLTAIKMALVLLTRRLPTDDPALTEKAAYIDSLVDRTIDAIHRIADDLRPSVLDFGLVAAIDCQLQEFEQQWGCTCTLTSNKRDMAFHPDQATALFRIFQEAMTNIRKHAHATRVTVRLHHTERTVRLEIADNGRGMDAADRTKPQSFGIRGMTERAAAIGGSLSITAEADVGCVVTVLLPV